MAKIAGRTVILQVHHQKDPVLISFLDAQEESPTGFWNQQFELIQSFVTEIDDCVTRPFHSHDAQQLHDAISIGSKLSQALERVDDCIYFMNDIFAAKNDVMNRRIVGLFMRKIVVSFLLLPFDPSDDVARRLGESFDAQEVELLLGSTTTTATHAETLIKPHSRPLPPSKKTCLLILTRFVHLSTDPFLLAELIKLILSQWPLAPFPNRTHPTSPLSNGTHSALNDSTSPLTTSSIGLHLLKLLQFMPPPSMDLLISVLGLLLAVATQKDIETPLRIAAGLCRRSSAHHSLLLNQLINITSNRVSIDADKYSKDFRGSVSPLPLQMLSDYGPLDSNDLVGDCVARLTFRLSLSPAALTQPTPNNLHPPPHLIHQQF